MILGCAPTGEFRLFQDIVERLDIKTGHMPLKERVLNGISSDVTVTSLASIYVLVKKSVSIKDLLVKCSLKYTSIAPVTLLSLNMKHVLLFHSHRHFSWG